MDATQDPVVGRRVLVLQVEDDWPVRSTLERLGLPVVGAVSSPEQAESLYRDADPDVVILSAGFNQGTPVTVARRLMSIRPKPMIFIADNGDRNVVHQAAGAGAFAFLHLPLTEDDLHDAIEVAIARFEELQTVLREKHLLAQTLETRKLVERAKGIFMKRLGLDEPAAHRKLQTESQNRRVTLAELAKRIIENEELFSA